MKTEWVYVAVRSFRAEVNPVRAFEDKAEATAYVKDGNAEIQRRKALSDVDEEEAWAVYTLESVPYVRKPA